MRRWLAPVLVLLGALAACDTASTPRPVAAQGADYPEAGVTYLHWDRGHGYQVNYLGQGVGWLWYPGNKGAVQETWHVETVSGQRYMCFEHPVNSYNPVTGTRGGQTQCQPLALLQASVVGALAGDVFDLSSGAVPYRLSRDRAPAAFARDE